MDKTYNSPPNWPRPPEGWMPEPGWLPDPSWGPAPPGWQFWVETSRVSRADTPSTPSSAGAHELRIFLSYRRSDCQPQANGLYDGLRNRLPQARVFMDIDSIPAGVDFQDHIQREISVCDVVLVMIGDNWLDSRPGSEVRRVDEEGDFVRLEVESALASSEVRTVPVLVENAQMPRASELPDSIARLARINAIELNDLRWRGDLDRLVDAVEAIGREMGKGATDASAGATATQTTPGPARALEPTPVLLADPGHAGVETAPPAPPEPRPPSPAPRTPVIAYVLIVVPFLSLGFAAWVPALWAGLKRPAGTRARRELFILSAALMAAIVVAILFIDSAPEDSTGESSGVLLAIGSLLWILTMVIGTVVAVAVRKPPVAEGPGGIQ